MIYQEVLFFLELCFLFFFFFGGKGKREKGREKSFEETKVSGNVSNEGFIVTVCEKDELFFCVFFFKKKKEKKKNVRISFTKTQYITRKVKEKKKKIDSILFSFINTL